MDYTYPYFHQSWNLFVPPASTNYQLYISENDSAGADVFQELLSAHQTNRLAGNGNLLLTFVNTIHYFEKNTQQRELLNGPVKHDLYFSMLEFSAKNYYQAKKEKRISNPRIILIVDGTDNGKRRVYFN